MMKVEGEVVMKKRSLLFLWLYAKLIIIGFFGVLIGANYILGVFWYEPKATDIEKRIRDTTSVDQRDNFGKTALMVASAEGENKFVELLIQQRAYVNARAEDQEGVKYTSLHFATFKNQFSILLFLLENKADFGAYANDDDGFTPIHFCYQMTKVADFKKTVQAFIDSGANINIRDKGRGMTLLHWVVESTQEGNLKSLIEDFGDIVDFDIKGIETSYPRKLGDNIWIGSTVFDYVDTYLHGSESQKLLKTVKEDRLGLVGDVNGYNDRGGVTGVMIAALKGKEQYLKNLLNIEGVDVNKKQDPNKSKIGNTALHFACLYDQPKMAKMLVEKGAKVSIRNSSGATPLHFAFRISDQKNRKEIMQLFLKKGANINDVDDEGNSLLHKLVHLGNFDFLKQLVDVFEAQINFRLKNKRNLDAIGIAQQYDLKNLKNLREIELFLRRFYKATDPYQVNVLGKDDLTPLMRSAKSGNIVDAKNLISRGADINMQNKSGDTALHFAIRFKNIDFISWLLGLKDKIVNVTKANAKGNQPIHELLSIGDSNPKTSLLQVLFDKGANINAVNTEGNTLAHLVIEKNDIEFMRHLKGKFGVNVKNQKGFTPIEFARTLKRAEIVSILEAK